MDLSTSDCPFLDRPGRLVQWHPDDGASLLGRVVCVGAENHHVAVAFAEVEEAVWLPEEALQAAASAERVSTVKGICCGCWDLLAVFVGGQLK